MKKGWENNVSRYKDLGSDLDNNHFLSLTPMVQSFSCFIWTWDIRSEEILTYEEIKDHKEIVFFILNYIPLEGSRFYGFCSHPNLKS